MANNMRWRWGETNPVCVEIGASVAVEIGDLLYLDSGSVYPASHLSSSGTIATKQSSFGSKFLGVAMQAKSSGRANMIRVATSGVFSFDCASASFLFGDLVTPAANSSSNGLEDQKIVETSTAAAGIGRVVRAEFGNVTNVYVQICSAIIGTSSTSAAAGALNSASSSSST